MRNLVMGLGLIAGAGNIIFAFWSVPWWAFMLAALVLVWFRRNIYGAYLYLSVPGIKERIEAKEAEDEIIRKKLQHARTFALNIRDEVQHVKPAKRIAGRIVELIDG